MAKVQFGAQSPYSKTSQTSWYTLPANLIYIPPDSGDTTITVSPKYHNRPDLLSYDLYGTPGYWWVFMMRNLDIIRDPIWGLVSGIELVTPSKDHITKVAG